MSIDPTSLLPASLRLPPHLAAHKYFFVCTLTIAAWDTLVLSPRTWRLLRTQGWPVLKIFFHILRLIMVIEFVAVGVAFFDTNFTLAMCQSFYLFEPICTAVLLALCSISHCIRIYGIYDRNRTILYGLGGLTAVQCVVTAICCAFYRVVPVEETQGCIAGPKHIWVGIYWVLPTLVYTASFYLAVQRSLKSTQGGKAPNYWYLMLRDNLNIYGAIWIVNMTNVLFWFIIKPTGPEDPIRTICTSLAAVLTTSMTLRIILGVRGPLSQGGSYSGTWASSTAASSQSRSLPGLNRSRTNPLASKSERSGQTYTVDVPVAGEDASDVKNSAIYENDAALGNVKVTVEQEVESDRGSYLPRK
jgi:hypothetical protein